MSDKVLSGETWTGLYSAGWQGLIVDDAFAHPAKYARGLIRMIYAWLNTEGLIHPGDTVIDPFGGVALGALDAMFHGLNWIGCELEPRFCALAQQNIDLWQSRYAGWKGWGTARIVQGDSRQLVRVVQEAGCVVSSPPYEGNSKADYLLSEDGKTRARDERRGYTQGRGCFRGSEAAYGQSPGQLGAMKPGDVDAICSSPPYAESNVTGERNFTGGGGNETPASSLRKGASAIVSSPPYAQSVHDGNGIDQSKLTGNTPGKNTQAGNQGYGQTPGQLGSLPAGEVRAVVSSPPYEGKPLEGGTANRREGNVLTKWCEENGRNPDAASRKQLYDRYGTTDGQVGALDGETFWSAAKLIVSQCFEILRPGGVAVFVCKDFVRNKVRVPFSAQWVQLCEACGFRLTHWHKASLVVDAGEQHRLFDEPEKLTKSRKSFFRRLAESKGSPPIDHEDVLVFKKE